MNQQLRVLSLGAGSGVVRDPDGEEARRLAGYARRVARYEVVVPSDTGVSATVAPAPNWRVVACRRGRLDGRGAMLLAAWRILRSEKFDVIQAQDPAVSGLLGLVLAARFRVPLNVCVFGPDPWNSYWLRNERTNRVKAVVARFVLRRSAGVQVDSVDSARSLAAAGIAPERIRNKPIVPVDLAEFLGLQPHVTATPPRVLFVGRFVAQKRIDRLFDALVAVRERGIDWRLEIAGSGPLEDELRAAAPTGTTFLGQLNRPQLLSAFGRASLFALTSDFEGNARVLMEAAAAGVPIVSTSVNGAAAIVDDDTGALVAIDDFPALVNALTSILSSASARIEKGKAARARADALLALDGASEQVAIWAQMTAPPDG